MHIYESKIWKLVPQFFICPGKKGIPAKLSLFLASPCEKQSVGGATYYYFFKFIHLFFFWLHLAKNIAWAARLYFSSPGGSKCFSTSTQSSSIALKAWTKSNKQNLTVRWTGNPFEIWRQVCTRQIFLVGWLSLEYWLTVCAIGPRVFPSRAVLLPWLNRWVVSRFGFGSENFRFGFGSGDSRQDLSVSPPGQSWAVQSKTEKCCSLLKLVNVWRRKNNTLSRIRPPGRWKTSRASPLKRK